MGPQILGVFSICINYVSTKIYMYSPLGSEMKN